MNLISCDECGVVLDANKIIFPVYIQDEQGIISDKAAWNGEEYVPVIQCPVCQSDIMEN